VDSKEFQDLVNEERKRFGFQGGFVNPKPDGLKEWADTFIQAFPKELKIYAITYAQGFINCLSTAAAEELVNLRTKLENYIDQSVDSKAMEE